MVRTLLCAALVLNALVWPSTVRANVAPDAFQLRSTGDLVDLCSAAPEEPMGTAALNFCQGFGVGVFRVLQEIQSGLTSKMFCMPDPVPTRNQALASFVQWGKTNPKRLNLPPQDGIVAFLSDQYRCQ